MNMLQCGEVVYIVGYLLPAYTDWNTLILMKQVPELQKQWGRAVMSILSYYLNLFCFSVTFESS